ncbi:MAG: HRDC domain-containing protein [Myxococcota bacterium]
MFEDTPLVMVESDQALRTAITALARAKVIGIDTESDSSYAYQEKVCLVQVSDLHTDYVIDPLSVRDLSPLKEILADRSIVKILHGADYDIVCLKRDFGFQIRGLFDTLIAAQLIGMERIGLADLIGRYFGVELDKQYQRHNWALRPLRPEHVEYARGDTHYLLALREILLRELRYVGRVRHFTEECRLLERREWHGRTFDPDGWFDMKRVGELDQDGLRVLRRLYLYRDKQARRMDRPSYKVIPDDALIDIARKRPRTERELDSLFNARSALRRRHGRALLEQVLAADDDDTPLPTSSRKSAAPKEARPKTRLRTRLRGRQAERVLADLKRWRIEVLARDPSLNAYSVASNATLKWIAAMRPSSLDELADVPEVRRWQVREFGEELLDRLDRTAPLDEVEPRPRNNHASR